MGVRYQLYRSLRHGQAQACLSIDRAREKLMAPINKKQNEGRLARIRNGERIRDLNITAIEESREDFIKCALFCHFTPSGNLQPSVQRQIASLHANGWQTLLLSTKLSPESIAWCEHNRTNWLIRSNEGRDFGAFQDGILLLYRKQLIEECSRLLLINDSCVAVSNLDQSSWPRFLEGDTHSILGFTDSYQNGYHLQSYALNIPKTVLAATWWQEFWQNLQSWKGTASIIREGEIGLSKQAIHNQTSLRALHPIGHLRSFSMRREFQAILQTRFQCSKTASILIQKKLFKKAIVGFAQLNPTHDLAIPLLADGCPLVKRDLLEANPCFCLDPGLIAFGDQAILEERELSEHLRPPIIGFKN